MKVSRALLFLTLATSAIQAHAGAPTFFEVPRDARVQSAEPGIVITSIGIVDDFAYGVKAIFRRLGSSKKGFITYDYKGATLADLSAGRSKTKVIKFQLEPGMYEIYDIALLTTDPGFTTRFSARQKIPISFEVKSGQTTYLGELVAETLFEEGTPPPYALPDGGLARKGRIAGAYFHVRDCLARDTRIAAADGQSSGQVNDAAPNFSASANPLFRWETGVECGE